MTVMPPSPNTEGQAYLDRQVRDADASLQKLEAQIQNLEQRVDMALAEPAATPIIPPPKPPQVMVWGVPFSRLSLPDTLRHIDALLAAGEPAYFITANLNYNMLTRQHPELAAVNEGAAFILCDGMPMLWRSQRTETPLPERVAGSELIYALSKWAAEKGHRIYFLGGAPGVAQAAADILSHRYPGLQVAGVHSPPFRPLTEDEESAIFRDIRDSGTDLLFVAFGQPRGELWMSKNRDRIGSALAVQLGASFDFVAGGVPRAPVWLQKMGMEWAYRMMQEPRRLFGRYFRNGLFLLGQLARELGRG